MALHRTPEEHDANPPSSWAVVKAAPRCWHLRPKDGRGTLGTFPRRKDAEEAKYHGFYVNLYETEGRWFRGEPVALWRPYQPAEAR